MKTTFPKANPKIIQHRDEKNFVEDFRIEHSKRLQTEAVFTYAHFDDFFLDVLNKHVPPKKKAYRANHKPTVADLDNCISIFPKRLV